MFLSACCAGLILFISLVAMQFTDEVNWTGFDFLAGAILLGSTGALMGALTFRAKSMPGRALATLFPITLLGLVWGLLI